MKKLLSLFFTLLMFSHLQGGNITWTPSPTMISGAGVNASSPQVAIDVNGNAIAVWVENNFVKSSTKLVNGSWSARVNVSATNASSPSVAMDQNGNATAVWIENGLAKAATKTLNGNWSSATSLSLSGASSPVICVDDAGDVIAAWVRNGNIETSTKLFGANWQSRTSITSSSATAPSIAIGGTGNNARAVIVWQGVSSGDNVIYNTSKLIRGSWTSAKVISEAGSQAVQPFVAVDANSNAIAVWYTYEIADQSYINVIVKSSSRDSVTGTWGAVSSLSQPGMRNPATLLARVAFDRIGNAIALWNTSFDDETFTIESAVKPINSHWSLPTNLINSNVYAYLADVSTTAFGDVLSLYMFYNGANLLIQSVESDMNGFLNNQWSVPITISTGTDNAYPKIASSLIGNVIHADAVWTHYNGSYTSIMASSGSKTLVLPPSNLNVTQSVNNFGVFNEYYNTLSWDASDDSNAVGYLIFRNGTFVAQVGADVLEYIDNNRAQSGPVTYGVSAIDEQQTQSVIVSVEYP